jgi:phosphatidylglycerophosphate synthase
VLESLTRLQADLQRLGKPREVEGILDRYLIRPCGYVVATWLTPSWVSPNILSLLALFFGWLTAYFLFQTAKLGNLPLYSALAGLSMLFHSAFDSADGQLARARGTTSEFGRILDGICDYLTFAAIYLAIGIGLGVRAGTVLTPFIVIAVVAGVSHALQCAVVEYQRNLYRHYVYETELPFDPSWVEGDHRGGEGGPLHTMHRAYSRLQQMFGGSSLHLWKRIDSWLRIHPEDSERTVGLIVANNRERLPMWALLAPNSHKVAMIVAAFLPVRSNTFFGELGLLWYFVYVIVLLNFLMTAMIVTQKQVDRRTWDEVESDSKRELP